MALTPASDLRPGSRATRSRSRFGAGSLAAAAGCVLAGAAFGQSAAAPSNQTHDATQTETAAAPAQAPIADPIERLVEQLDAADLTVRTDAQQKIAAGGAMSLTQVESFLAQPGLSHEQRLRLEAAGRELFADEPRAGLGVRFGNPAAVERGVPLAGVVDGFPASKVLRPGDIVLSINGQPLSNQTHMGALILSHLPGEALRVEIERPRLAPGDAGRGLAQPAVDYMVLDVPLGRYEDLQTGVELTPARLEMAFRQRLARMAGTRPAMRTIGSGLTPNAWLRTEGYDAGRGLAPESRMERVPAWRLVGFGGQPHADLAAVDLRRGDSTAMRTRANRALQANGIYDEIEEALAGYRALAHRLTEIRVQVGDAERAAASDSGDNPSKTRRLRALLSESADIERTLVEIRGVFDRAGVKPETEQSSGGD